jgi:acetyltransferase-like isoleucine patch superfamily enzyme
MVFSLYCKELNPGKNFMIKNVIGRFLHALAFIVPFGKRFRPFLHRLRGVKVGKNVWISKLVYIDENHPEAISIGDNTTIGFRTTIYSHFYFGRRRKVISEKVVIGNNVFIGPHCLILPNVRIGDNVVIMGGSVISKNIPPNTMWGPAATEMISKITVPLTSEYSYDEFLNGIRPVRKRIAQEEDRQNK